MSLISEHARFFHQHAHRAASVRMRTARRAHLRMYKLEPDTHCFSKSPSEFQSKNKPKMALRVPLTRRDFFFEDPFFASVWEDFEKLRRDIWSGHGAFLQNGDFWPASRFSSVFPEKRWFYPENFFDDDDFKLIPQLKDELLKGIEKNSDFPSLKLQLRVFGRDSEGSGAGVKRL